MNKENVNTCCQEVQQSTKSRDGFDVQISDRDFEITMITVLKGLMEKVKSIHKLVGNFSRDM